jgi:hypothetical protein
MRGRRRRIRRLLKFWIDGYWSSINWFDSLLFMDPKIQIKRKGSLSPWDAE